MPTPPPSSAPVVFRWPRARALRVAGLLIALAGLLWLAAITISAVTPAGGGLVLGAGLVASAALLTGVLLVLRPPKVLSLSSDGYAVHHLRGAGVQSATWGSVGSVSTEAAGGGDALVVRLSGDRHTVVPVALLGPHAGEAQRRIHDLLNRAHGYRRLSA